MPAPASKFSLGLPVEIGKIGKELKKLWDQNDGAMTRASLVNLALYSEKPDSLSENTKLISQLTEDHACRAIVIGAHPDASENRVEAWVSAHCHVSRAGSKQVCSEQLSFLLEGPCTALLPNIVFSQLDSDLPFYLWWQGEFHDPMDPQLWAWVDRVIYDSQVWKDFNAQMRLVETAQEETRQRVVLCDLNWTRLDRVRLAVAQFFDHPAAHHHFAKIERVEIEFAPTYRSTAVLLAGWLAAQLHWKAESGKTSSSLRFQDAKKRSIEVALRERAGEPIGGISLVANGVEFHVSQPQGADLLQVSRGKPGDTRNHQMMPALSNDLVTLMGEELMRGGPHRVYLRAVTCVRDLL